MSDDEDMEEYDPEEEEPEEEKDEKETDEEEKEEGEEAEEFIPNPITEDIMKEGLSLLCKTGNGLSHAYVKLEAKDKELTDISLLSSYIHLRYVDLSENRLSDLSPLNNLTHLLWLKLDYNRLQSARMVELPYLQIASFAYNQIIDTEGITHPKLASLDLKGNNIKKITGLDPQKLSNLHTLELRGNQLESTLGLELPKLKSLYLAQNQLKKIEGIENLQQLSTLHLRDNKISELDGFSSEMKLLQYLNLRGNLVTNMSELIKLKDLPQLRALILLENPCTDETDYRQEALVHLPQLERLDKEFYEEEERAEADEIRQRLKEEQEQEVDQDLDAYIDKEADDIDDNAF
ncbi:leucine-rich repeat-containing protein 23 isoform X1 [Sarcophilus harrisii]|uniref:leucine-rich repeat-containing protein 23 isoform X1 n=1 Tax=Sarcophilus harrisii TaxID=9305 RepID=UPI000273BCDA|nr:leucine-rich repeat-containing protein 23 isoform X1 [Sarcophilus harrisii]XP_031794115.1 leucine-rich repeat-containing protein 23 isoform X1 [Sarcophilus harrisii]XP_031794116.1 leucine-rich repeat-containing protein 23 isoform X1 [Sarcophilus harrisii]